MCRDNGSIHLVSSFVIPSGRRKDNMCLGNVDSLNVSGDLILGETGGCCPGIANADTTTVATTVGIPPCYGLDNFEAKITVYQYFEIGKGNHTMDDKFSFQYAMNVGPIDESYAALPAIWRSQWQTVTKEEYDDGSYDGEHCIGIPSLLLKLCWGSTSVDPEQYRAKALVTKRMRKMKL